MFEFITETTKLVATIRNIVLPKVSAYISEVNLFLFLWEIKFFLIRIIIDLFSHQPKSAYNTPSSNKLWKLKASIVKPTSIPNKTRKNISKIRP